MTQGLRELQPYDLAAELERELLPRLVELLGTKAPGHCMRLVDLDRDLMIRLCGRLRAEAPGAEVVILGNGREPGFPPELFVSSTKLVELRNPRADGTLRPPLLVFLPSDLRTAAEDSFGVATFEEIEVRDVYRTLRDRLLAQLPPDQRSAIAEALARLSDPEHPWPFSDLLAQVRFLLTATLSGADPEALGGALYELGLVPDFELLNDPVRAPTRVMRNRDCVRKLTWSDRSERGRVLDLGLFDRAFRTQLANFLAEAGLEDPRSWTRRIVLDRSHWGLAFHRWTFDEPDSTDTLTIDEVATNLPVVPEDAQDPKLVALVGQQILAVGKNGTSKFNVSFRVDPHPSKVQGLAKFVVQIISKSGGPVGLARSKGVWKEKRSETLVSFSKLTKVEWEEGWHFARVLAQTDDGDLLPLVDEHGNPLPWAAGDDSAPVQRSNESDLFYVVTDLEDAAPPPDRALDKRPSLEHARQHLQFAALLAEGDPRSITPTAIGWSDRAQRGRSVGLEFLEVRFGRAGTIQIPVSRPLKALEQKILAAPDGPLAWQIPISLGVAGPATGETVGWPSGGATRTFLQARREWFSAVRGGTKELVTQGADLCQLQGTAVAYAEAYLRLVEELLVRASQQQGKEAYQALAELRRVLAIDSVLLALTDHRGHRGEATLVAPTHPLRALWLTVWAALGQAWVQRASRAEKVDVLAARDALASQLAPLGFPAFAISTAPAGRTLPAVDAIHPLWTLYAPTDEQDPRGLVGDVCAAFGLPEPGVGASSIDGKYLATRVERYLIQHPYVRTLVINALNPGRCGVLAEMLLALQRRPAFEDLRYDLRLFVRDPDALGVGDALLQLLSPAASLTGQEADAFVTVGESHLRPKLALAIRHVAEFQRAPERHAAHLSFLFDLFPTEEVGAERASTKEGTAPVHGLIQDFHHSYQESPEVVAWSRYPRHGQALPLNGAEPATDLLSALAEALSTAMAAVATGDAGSRLRPVVKLALDREARALLHQVHEVSDWVLTLDRNMGIEFFDHGGRRDRPDYLIDHSPDPAGNHGHRLVVTSRSITELEAMLCPILAQYGLPDESRHAVAVLDQLRSLSGRLALKLLSAPTQRAEALGLALSRMFLSHHGVFSNHVVVPLDAHLELYRVLKRQGDELGDEVSFKRTDLALFDLDASTRTITCRLVEVKCYAQTGDLAAYSLLKDRIAEQLRQSEEVLSRHFDPYRCDTDRPDRLLKTRELVALLEFYLERAVRYQLMEQAAEEEGRFLLRTLEAGYRLNFTRSAIIFDFEKGGTEPAEREGGIEYHRIGLDLLCGLVEAAARSADESTPGGAPSGDSGGPGPQEAPRETRRGTLASLPGLTEAAFLGNPRDRSVSWEDLRARIILTEGEEERGGFTQMVGGMKQEEGRAAVAEVPSTDRYEGDARVTPLHSIAVGERLQLEPAPVPWPSPVVETPKSGSTSSPGQVPLPFLEHRPAGGSVPQADVLLGTTSPTPQFGVLGEVSGRKVGLDLNQTHTISLFGVQGGGKSYTLGSIAEMATMAIPGINALPKPLATVIFHYSPTMDYRPEFTSMVLPNSDHDQAAALRVQYGAEPAALEDVVLLVPADKLSTRRAEYPTLAVHPLKFAAAELQASHWRFLMGAVGNQATYIRQINRIMKGLRDDLTLEALRAGIDESALPDHMKDMARMRLDLAAEYIDDTAQLSSIIRPGRLIIVDLRDEFIEKDEALGLFVVLLQLFADAQHDGAPFNKLVVFDEAHKYIESPDLVAGLIEVVREMRHKGTSILVASQDPPSVPVALIELSSQIILHKFNSPAWLKHIQKANAALVGLNAEKMANLRSGEAYIWSSKATDEAFTRGAMKVHCRPRVTLHGGGTKTAM